MTEKGLAQQTSIGNRLLDAIPATEYEQMCLKMEHVSMDFNAVLFAPGEAIHHVFFPISGVVSLLAVVDDRLTVDVGMVGSEGMVGLSLLLGATTSLGWAIVQGGGEALRMKRADFLDECRNADALPAVLLRHTRSMFAQIAQSAACYRVHALEPRLARRLLMMLDRMGCNEIRMTHDHLSKMLGVRREAITRALRSLQGARLIDNSRGNIAILDRPGLEVTACQCYRAVRDEELSSQPR